MAWQEGEITPPPKFWPVRNRFLWENFPSIIQNLGMKISHLGKFRGRIQHGCHKICRLSVENFQLFCPSFPSPLFRPMTPLFVKHSWIVHSCYDVTDGLGLHRALMLMVVLCT